MSIGMSAGWRSKQPKQKRCDRCELYYAESLVKCVHCSELSNSQLAQLKEQHQDTLQNNFMLGKYLIFGSVIIGILLLFSFL